MRTITTAVATAQAGESVDGLFGTQRKSGNVEVVPT